MGRLRAWYEQLFVDDTWTCHVCKRRRPDAQISVRQHAHTWPTGVTSGCNVRYCTDDEDCGVRSLFICWWAAVETRGA